MVRGQELVVSSQWSVASDRSAVGSVVSSSDSNRPGADSLMRHYVMKYGSTARMKYGSTAVRR